MRKMWIIKAKWEQSLYLVESNISSTHKEKAKVFTSRNEADGYMDQVGDNDKAFNYKEWQII